MSEELLKAMTIMRINEELEKIKKNLDIIDQDELYYLFGTIVGITRNNKIDE